LTSSTGSHRPSLIVVTGPSGAGKGTLIRKLLERVPDLEVTVSATTRAPRAGEEDGDGSFEVLTVKPGRLTMPSGAIAAPHIDVSLFARGMLHRVVTRWYFADEEEANATDPVLARVPAERRETLLAKPVSGGYQIDIHVQGPGETVFFDL